MFRFGRILVLAARPEKALEPIALASWHNVYVDMGHTLAHAIVNGYESAFSPQPLFHRPRQTSGHREKPAGQSVRQLNQVLVMVAGNDQAVAGEQRPVIQKHQYFRLIQNNVRFHSSSGHLAEEAAGHFRFGVAIRHACYYE